MEKGGGGGLFFDDDDDNDKENKKKENGWFGRLRRPTVRSGVVCVLFFF